MVNRHYPLAVVAGGIGGLDLGAGARPPVRMVPVPGLPLLRGPPAPLTSTPLRRPFFQPMTFSSTSSAGDGVNSTLR